ncbi:hypothetical protein TUBRATIS_25260 [Tubulinosema ratisbonensis]|uniref:Uncharacterized protein n=1 Tax=Tubulinosema ratisbonensis TaxID=291195 RepID=A0A437AIZ3_9MICR|nr:hypothetical protein TUBRATIS_25260 [Tubulinosema ratisbonensis]
MADESTLDLVKNDQNQKDSIAVFDRRKEEIQIFLKKNHAVPFEYNNGECYLLDIDKDEEQIDSSVWRRWSGMFAGLVDRTGSKAKELIYFHPKASRYIFSFLPMIPVMLFSLYFIKHRNFLYLSEIITNIISINAMTFMRCCLFLVLNFKYTIWIDIIWSVVIIILMIIINQLNFGFKITKIDYICEGFFCYCLILVYLFNFLMSKKISIYFKFILPIVFVLSFIFFAIFYRFVYFEIKYIFCMGMISLINYVYVKVYKIYPVCSDMLLITLNAWYLYFVEAQSVIYFLNKN